MNTKNEKAVINEENLDAVTGGTTAPELPATQLGEIANEEKDAVSEKVGIIPGLPAFP